MAADDILQQVNDLNKKLEDAQNAQDDSRKAIDKANNDIAETRESLKQVNIVLISRSHTQITLMAKTVRCNFLFDFLLTLTRTLFNLKSCPD